MPPVTPPAPPPPSSYTYATKISSSITHVASKRVKYPIFSHMHACECVNVHDCMCVFVYTCTYVLQVCAHRCVVYVLLVCGHV